VKTQDRIVSLVLVGAVIGGIWWAGYKWRGGGVAEGGADASAEASSEASSSSAVATADSSAPSPLPEASIEAAAASGACRAMNTATTQKLDEAKKARACTPEFDTSMLACRTSPNGATWGLRVDDVVDISGASDGIDTCATGWLVRLVHLDVDGVESAMVPGIAAKLRAHTYNVTHDTRIAEVAFFDWDGDGDDEVLVRGTRGPDEQRATVWAFRPLDGGAARIAPYEPTAPLTIVGARDVDGDGRPDLLVSFFGTSREAPPTTHRFLAHSLTDGTFSLRDAAAVTWAEKECPSEPKLDLAQKTPADFDSTLADDMACTLVWGRDPKDLAADVAKACRAASADAGTCPAWARLIVKTKPPLSLR
jgi:hypothetical protein